MINFVLNEKGKFMKQKILIVGGVAGGASTAARLRRVNEEAEIIMFERGPYISFANCGLPYYIGGTITKRSRLLLQTPEAMNARFNIDVRVMNEVMSIDKANKTVEVTNHETGETYTESYDVLVLSPGSSPLKPPIEGIDADNIFSLWNVPDTDKIKAFIDENDLKTATVIGGGFIGIEMAENLHDLGLEVAIAEMAPQVMAPIDYEMAQILHEHMYEKGIKLHLNNGVNKFVNKGPVTDVVLNDGTAISSDIVILAIGVRANSELAKNAGLEVNQRGGIVTDDKMQTSDPSIFAVGDAVEVKEFVEGGRTMIPLAGPANKQGRIVANIISGIDDAYKGTQGTSVAKVFDMAVASTGLNEKQLERMGKVYKKDYLMALVRPNHHVTYYPGYMQMTLKVLFYMDGKVLGAQAVGYEGVEKRIDVIATAIRFGGKMSDLRDLELAYAPPFSSAKDPVNMAGFVGENILSGIMEPMIIKEVEEIDFDHNILLDVRTEREFSHSSIEGAINMDVNTIRDRIDELDKDKTILVYCAVGVRGHTAVQILRNHGFKTKNLLGGYSFYDIVTGDYTAK